jgi:hypothetical protein
MTQLQHKGPENTEHVDLAQKLLSQCRLQAPAYTLSALAVVAGIVIATKIPQQHRRAVAKTLNKAVLHTVTIVAENKAP